MESKRAASTSGAPPHLPILGEALKNFARLALDEILSAPPHSLELQVVPFSMTYKRTHYLDESLWVMTLLRSTIYSSALAFASLLPFLSGTQAFSI